MVLSSPLLIYVLSDAAPQLLSVWWQARFVLSVALDTSVSWDYFTVYRSSPRRSNTLQLIMDDILNPNAHLVGLWLQIFFTGTSAARSVNI